MSVLALGTIFLVGGVIGVVTSMMATAAGTAIILTKSSNSEIPFSSSIPRTVYEVEQQIEELKSNLQNLLTIADQSITNKEMQEEKEKLIMNISNLNNLLDQHNYYAIQNEANKLVKQFNETLVNNHLISLQKNEVLEQIKKLESKIHNQEDLQKIQSVCSNPDKYTLNEMEKIFSYLEEKYHTLDIQITDPRQKIKDKIQTILEKIKNIDEEYWNEIQSKYKNLDNMDQTYLNLLLDQINLDMSKIKTKQIRKIIYYSQLNHYLQILKSYGEYLENDQEFRITIYYPSLLKTAQNIQDLLTQKYIDKNDFERVQTGFLELLNSIQKYIEQKHLKESMKKNLQNALLEMGYHFIDTQLMERLINGEVVYLNLPYSEEYKVQIKLTKDNKIFFRLVKFVESLDATEYEKQKDLEMAKKWCQDYDKILELLKQNGIIIENIQRVEPEQMEIAYILEEKKKEQTQQQKYLQIE